MTDNEKTWCFWRNVTEDNPMRNIEKILLVTLVGAIFGGLIGFILPFPYGLIVIFPASIIVGWYGDEIHRFFFRDK